MGKVGSVFWLRVGGRLGPGSGRVIGVMCVVSLDSLC